MIAYKDNTMAKVVSSRISTRSGCIIPQVMGPVSYFGPAAQVRYRPQHPSDVQSDRADMRDGTTLATIYNLQISHRGDQREECVSLLPKAGILQGDTRRTW